MKGKLSQCRKAIRKVCSILSRAANSFVRRKALIRRAGQAAIPSKRNQVDKFFPANEAILLVGTKHEATTP